MLLRKMTISTIEITPKDFKELNFIRVSYRKWADNIKIRIVIAATNRFS